MTFPCKIFNLPVIFAIYLCPTPVCSGSHRRLRFFPAPADNRCIKVYHFRAYMYPLLFLLFRSPTENVALLRLTRVHLYTLRVCAPCGALPALRQTTGETTIPLRACALPLSGLCVQIKAKEQPLSAHKVLHCRPSRFGE